MATALGLSIPVLRKLRREHLIEGEDWRIEGRFVVYTLSGRDRMSKLLENELQSHDPDGGKGPIEIAMPEPAGEVERADLWLIKTVRNPRIVLAALTPGGEPDQRVRVRSSANFLPGMVLPCLREAENLWTLGRACPRWRGKW